MRLIIISILSIFFFFILGCAQFQNLSPEQKIDYCQKAFSLLRPQCSKLSDKGEQYVNLCTNIVDDAISRCEPLINKEPDLICDIIMDRADECKFVLDKSENKDLNISVCESVIQAVGSGCKLSFVLKSEKDNTE